MHAFLFLQMAVGLFLFHHNFAALSRLAVRSSPLSSMATETSSCDYLVVGAGASGMSFVDTLLLHAPEPVLVTLLDKREQPGGHWNDAYDYVTLHCTSKPN